MSVVFKVVGKHNRVETTKATQRKGQEKNEKKRNVRWTKINNNKRESTKNRNYKEKDYKLSDTKFVYKNSFGSKQINERIYKENTKKQTNLHIWLRM